MSWTRKWVDGTLVARGAGTEQQGTWKMRHALHAQRCGNQEKNLPPPSAEQKSRKLERFLLSASFLWFQQKKNLSEISFSKNFLNFFKKLI